MSKRTKQLEEVNQQFQKQLTNIELEMQVVANQIRHATSNMSRVITEQQGLMKNTGENLRLLSNANNLNLDNVELSVSLSDSLTQNTSLLAQAVERLHESVELASANVAKQLESLLKNNSIIQQIEEKNQVSTHSLDTLTMSIAKIHALFETVKAFYKQTDLLALNASIESARAGEAGRGFAVVAGEIQALAKKSYSSTSEIQTIMNEIHASIQEVSASSSETSSHIKEAVSHSITSEKELNTLNSSFSLQSEQMNSMTHVLHKNAQGIHDLHRRIDEIRQSSVQVNEEISQLENAVSLQAEKTQQLTSFKANVEDAQQSMSILAEKMSSKAFDFYQDKFTAYAKEQIDYLQQLLGKQELLDLNATKAHQTLFEKVLKENAKLEAIWSNRADGSFISSIPLNIIPNAKHRDWFIDAIKGNVHISTMYISSISKKPCITLAMPIRNKVDIIGVIGIDLSFQMD